MEKPFSARLRFMFHYCTTYRDDAQNCISPDGLRPRKVRDRAGHTKPDRVRFCLIAHLQDSGSGLVSRSQLQSAEISNNQPLSAATVSLQFRL